MPGRNDPCPCGSGRKYKKCCLEKLISLDRACEIATRAIETFQRAVDKVQRAARDEFGTDWMDEWSQSYQSDDPSRDAQFFFEIVVTHVPIPGYSNLVGWAKNRVHLSKEESEILDQSSQTPYSYWQLPDSEGFGFVTVQDLLSGSGSTILLPEAMGELVGNPVLFGKIVTWKNVNLFLSFHSTVFFQEMAELAASQVLGGREVLSPSELLEPTTCHRLYQIWNSELDRHQREAPEPEGFQMTYTFDPRRRAWLLASLRSWEELREERDGFFVYPRLESHLSALDEKLVLQCFLPKQFDVVKKLLLERTGTLLVELAEAPLYSLEQQGEPEDPTVEELCDEFLDKRARTVSQSTLERDEEALNRLQLYLYEQVQELPGSMPYGELLHHLDGFFRWVPTARIIRDSEVKGTFTAVKQLLSWMKGQRLLEPDDFQSIVETYFSQRKLEGPLTYRLHLHLEESEPSVWRELLVPGRYRLGQLHKMIQLSYGWEDYHLHEFQLGDVLYTDMESHDPEFDRGELDEKLSLQEALGWRRSFQYRYDFGDSWEVAVRVKERLEGDREAPECVAGAMAGPPEDCGGISGFQDLKAVLADPRHPEYKDMRRWAPHGYQADNFSASSLSKRLAAKFGRKRSGAKAPDQSVLAGYRLKKMNLAQAIVAALQEKSPRTLDEIHQRLVELNYPLKSGRNSLQRSLSKIDCVRERLDGALETVPGRPLKLMLSRMQYSSQEGEPKPPRPEIELEPVIGPVTTAELEWAKKESRVPFPGSMSLRRLTIIVLETLGGKATVGEVRAELGRLQDGRQPTIDDILQTLKGSSAIRIQNDTLHLSPDDQENERTREVYRQWTLPYRKREADMVSRFAAIDARTEERKEEIREERARLSKLQKVFVAAHWDREAFALALLRADEEPAWFTDPAEAKREIEAAGVVIGLDPKTGFEQMGWELPETLVVDITPPFKSVPTRGSSRRPVTFAEAVKMSLGARPNDPDEVAAWAEKKDAKKLRKALESDVRLLQRYWRYGVVHHAVRKGPDWAVVEWNVTKEISLHDALEWSREDQEPVDLTLVGGTSGLFMVDEILWRARYGEENLAVGRWVEGDAKKTNLTFDRIADCRYLGEPTVERLARVLW